MSDELIFLQPVFHHKIWGGRMLEEQFDYELPDTTIGECWAISAHPAGDCQVATGAYKGLYLSELFRAHRELFGDVAGDQFPLLVKVLAADDDLSIQVHPDNDYAYKHEDGALGKSECWYVLYAKPGATILIGQHAQSPEEFAHKVEQGKWDELLNIIPVKAGDFFQISPGCVHAVRGGTMVLETQQSSDITYRVYDYDRRQADGTLRTLHMKQSLDCIDFSMGAPTEAPALPAEKRGVTRLVACDVYTVDRVRVSGELTMDRPGPFLCVSVIEGAGSINGCDVNKGQHCIVPATANTLVLAGDMELICSYPPSSDK
ncbi:type I phosphomannose isomerase catalytic subunit [Atopobium deltae]|uniref:Phosphohexomutase n=1 Tax=Atopobium deltae TaxID=1393034 RepID=A0A133XTU1_9ACTN|nr:type I phosphomannose isomerase catalytic subunit [Atopobium deltae]KXB34355.1 mannose-6-phosphate isomerase, class I [Atopobium deltae]